MSLAIGQCTFWCHTKCGQQLYKLAKYVVVGLPMLRWHSKVIYFMGVCETVMMGALDVLGLWRINKSFVQRVSHIVWVYVQNGYIIETQKCLTLWLSKLVWNVENLQWVNLMILDGVQFWGSHCMHCGVNSTVGKIMLYKTKSCSTLESHLQTIW
jgi:hypothetical protein